MSDPQPSATVPPNSAETASTSIEVNESVDATLSPHDIASGEGASACSSAEQQEEVSESVTDQRLFLDEALPSLQDKSVDEVASLIDQIASSVSNDDVDRQIASHQAEMDEMKEFMERAEAEGLLDDDQVDEDAEDGTILLKSKAGDYNPIMESYEKKSGTGGQASVASAKTLPLEAPVNKGNINAQSGNDTNQTKQNAPSKRVADTGAALLHVPLSGEVDSNSVLRYAAAATQDALRRGESPVVPLLSMGMAVGFGKLTKDAMRAAERSIVAWLPTAPRVVVYTDCDLEKRFDGTQFVKLCAASHVEIRSLQKNSKPQTVDKSHLVHSDESAPNSAQRTAEATIGGSAGDERAETADPAPNKTRVNRYTRTADNKPVKEFPDGVAGFTADGRPIPIVNDGPTFDPKLPNVMGDMTYRNNLLATPKFDPKHWFYKRWDKKRYLVFGSMGPKNCNLKYDKYYMCCFCAAANKSECATIAAHVRKDKNCYHGRMFNLGVIPIGEWFAVAPPRFSKDATATYSNPLHREYMEEYINEQKRATVELEQRVLDDEVRARNKTNTLVNQLREKQMNPALAPSNAQAQCEIAAQREANKLQDEQRALAQAEAAKEQQQDQGQKQIAGRRSVGGTSAARGRRRLARGGGAAGRGRGGQRLAKTMPASASRSALQQQFVDPRVVPSAQNTNSGEWTAQQRTMQRQTASQRPAGVKIE